MILSQCERVDQEEEGLSSLVKMKKELENKQVLKSKVSEVLNELEKDQRESKNTVDPDSTVVNSIHGSHTCYNVQSVVDEKHGLIVNTDVVSRNNDYSQFAEQINQATETLGKQCLIACADAGYTNIENVKKLHDRGVHVVAPSKKQASKNVLIK